MYHKIRITVVSLALVAICALSSATTLSYYTDTDTQSNRFTIGNASTTLKIYSDDTGSAELDPSEDDPLTDGDTIPFYLQATNNGNIPVYQRFRIVIPTALAQVVELNLPTMDEGCTIKTAQESTCSNEHYTVTYKPSVQSGDAPVHAEYYIASKQVLGLNQQTVKWPTFGLRIGGISNIHRDLFTCADNDDNNCVFGISAYSDAIQTTGFNDVSSAFANFTETY